MMKIKRTQKSSDLKRIRIVVETFAILAAVVVAVGLAIFFYIKSDAYRDFQRELKRSDRIERLR